MFHFVHKKKKTRTAAGLLRRIKLFLVTTVPYHDLFNFLGAKLRCFFESYNT